MESVAVPAVSGELSLDLENPGEKGVNLAPGAVVLLTTFAYMQTALQDYGLIIATEKVQHFPPYSYLGFFSGK